MLVDAHFNEIVSEDQVIDTQCPIDHPIMRIAETLGNKLVIN